MKKQQVNVHLRSYHIFNIYHVVYYYLLYKSDFTGIGIGIYREYVRVLLYWGRFQLFTWWPQPLHILSLLHGFIKQRCLNNHSNHNSISYKFSHSCFYLVWIPKIEDFVVHGNVYFIKYIFDKISCLMKSNICK